ncbi:MAG: SGNH/GDSL hydrolase family protein, partial [Sandaracinaceae bacterium]|nr:SGNH/GDSL hydrolase family protein [Sandaracinaceae bacterium]
EGVISIALRSAVLVVSGLLVALAVRAYRARPARRPETLAMLIVASFVVSYGAQLARGATRGTPLPSLGMHAPGSTEIERHPGRPRAHYRFNRHGFRGPDWPVEAQGPRLCLIGDSFVFGSGVEWPDTLGERLRPELERAGHAGVEVLSLGVAGHNLRSHVTLCDHAARALHCSALVLALTLPNDLSAWDINTEVERRAQVGGYSLTELALGPEVPALIWNTGELARGIGPSELAVLTREWHRLRALRAQGPRPPILVLSYFAAAVPWESLPAVPDLRVDTDSPRDDAMFIPGDGHPSAHGNTVLARWLAGVLASDPRFARALRP